MALSRAARQYLGVRAILPPDLQTATRNPTSSDKAYVKGTLWLNTATPGAFMWPGSGSWISLGTSSSGDITTLTGNSGGALSPTLGNINILGAGALAFAGSGSTLTGSITPGTALVATIAGNSGGARSPTAGAMSIIGSGAVAVAGSGSTLTISVTAGTALIATLTGGSGGALSPTSGNFNLLGTASQITSTGAGSTITFSLPSAVIAPGSVAATTTLTATLGAITATNGNFVGSTAGSGLLFNSPAASGVAASPVVVNGRSGQATFTTVSIAAAADLTLTITNSAITGATTQVIYSMSGATTGAALSIKSVTNTAGSSAIVVTNGTGATTSTADIVMNFIVIN